MDQIRLFDIHATTARAHNLAPADLTAERRWDGGMHSIFCEAIARQVEAGADQESVRAYWGLTEAAVEICRVHGASRLRSAVGLQQGSGA